MYSAGTTEEFTRLGAGQKLRAWPAKFIQNKGADDNSRVVGFGQLVLFSTESGDAWLLDASDQLAVRLARDGDPESIHLEATDTSFTIGWNGRYHIDGPAFYLQRSRDWPGHYHPRLSHASNRSSRLILIG